MSKGTKMKSRTIPVATKLLLAVSAGGRCEFEGCNEYLFEHPVTLRGLNLSENAHIYPFSEDGPRGDEAGRPADIHAIENLMLLCPVCHDEIDKNKKHYPVDMLRRFKNDHEERVHYLTGLGPEVQTAPLIMKGRIAGRPVDITFSEIRDAVAPLYPADRKGFVIDLSALGDENSAVYYELAAQRIRQRMREFYGSAIDGAVPRHISVFALAPIPLLALLGSCLSDKIATSLFQRHRGADKPWRWQSGSEPVRYAAGCIQQGSDPDKIALLLSLSGKIDRATLPPEIDARFSLYEITLEGIDPDPGFLRQRGDLDGFRHAYRNLLSRIMAAHSSVGEIHLFPAVPAPVAVMCGHEILPKVQPALLVYDNDKAQGGFVLRVKVNDHEQRRLSA